MLGKVMKHEIKSTSRLFLPLMAGFIIVTILCRFAFESSSSVFLQNNRVLDLIRVIFMTLYFIYIVALFVMTSVFIVIHFYKTMVSDQGYLTNTLPVKTSTIINGKLLTAVMWEIVSGLLLILSIFTFFIGNISMSDLQEFFRDCQTLMEEAAQYVNLPLLITEFTIGAIVSLLSGPLMLYAAIALGHLFRKHRVLWAVISYLGIYVIMQILSSVFFGICGYSSPSYYSGDYAARTMENYMMFSVIFSIACTAGFYAITDYIFSRKLNLE